LYCQVTTNNKQQQQQQQQLIIIHTHTGATSSPIDDAKFRKKFQVGDDEVVAGQTDCQLIYARVYLALVLLLLLLLFTSLSLSSLSTVAQVAWTIVCVETIRLLCCSHVWR
jgi:hypothetical protein